MKIIPIKRALISVSDKTNIVEFAKSLIELDIEIISTGGTSRLLKAENIAHHQVEDITGMSEMMDGRVKTLHPRIHAGILGRRDEHQEEAFAYNIHWIDLVVVNFYPFKNAIANASLTLDDAIELIDVGGPTMVRAAAKNMEWVGVLTDPSDYHATLLEIQQHRGLSFATRKQLAKKAFAKTAQYDAMICDYLSETKIVDTKHEASIDNYPDEIQLSLSKHSELRYGENPHQKACAYVIKDVKNTGILSQRQLQGKSLSYNNLVDAEAAQNIIREFNMPAAVIIKHANPSGVAEANDINIAFTRAYQADTLSAFGGIVALNRCCTKEIAEMMSSIFMEIILAPDYEADALKIFASKPNLRVLKIDNLLQQPWEMKFIQGGFLLQERDEQQLKVEQFNIVTEKMPVAESHETILFAWRVLKHMKSNGILIAKDKITVGIGAGLVSRVDAVDLAIRKAGCNIEDSILASDAFFPFRDSIDRIAKSGIRTIIQPGGSIRDDEVIAACNEHHIAMIMTGTRCFRH